MVLSKMDDNLGIVVHFEKPSMTHGSEEPT